MKKSLRFIALILAVVFMISGTVMLACSAVGEDAVGGDTPAPQEPVNNDPAPAEEPVNNDPAPAVEEPDNNSGGNVISDDNSGYDNSYDNDNGSGSGDNNYYVEDSDPLYYGDASNLSYNVSDSNEAVGSVSSNTPLYNASGMSAEDAAPNEWSDIVLDEKTVKTGVADFSAIKSNTEVQDNGDWILYLGYALLALAALGILYFIIATVAHRSAAKKEAARMERRRASSPARSEAARMEARERREAGAQRTSRFADENPGYSRRASSRADTDEVYVPRRAAKKH
ncbi:MAG: hypothetical protein IJH40_04730 [Ruminococcus sp.]|uniref:hypothetical protein n=1 Tax=Ruminococcus sp. TaxID=41978 RepID=UPI002872D1E3|nr:hypothetical protein [Ruminococcus sp.]MBQ3284931.1 hypothetical protein [Ruminococcus sp.]